MKDTYKVEDCGLFVGLLTTPPNMQEDTFFREEIAGCLCKKYREGLLAKMRNCTSLADMYEPVGFKLLSDHNLGVLMLIDDFAYPNRVFHPAHGLRKKEGENPDYDYQIYTCIDTYPDSTEHQGLKDFYIECCQRKDLPFLCVLQLKVNNGLLLGNGIDYTELVKARIAKEAECFPSMKVRTFDCLGNSELLVIIFSDRLGAMALFTHRVRSLNLKSLADVDQAWYEAVKANSVDTN